MSGPIVRKYGFPNFEKIFGQRDAKHGVDDTEAPAAGSTGNPVDAKLNPATWDDPSKPPFDAKVNPATEFGAAVE